MRNGGTRRLLLLILVAALLIGAKAIKPMTGGIAENGEYYTHEEVAEYINTYGELPQNYVTKNEARSMGWYGGNPMDEIGYCIGGDYYGNYEKKLPNNRYYECDVDYDDDSRGECRLVYTKDGEVYFTDDHYATFTQLY